MSLFDQFPYTNLHELNLDWVLERVKILCGKYQELEIEFDELKKEFEELGLHLGEEVDKWLREQGREYVEKIISEYIATSVYFGLTDSGYFVAYIPESWDSIQFATTELDTHIPIQPEYGHLVLIY